MTAHRWGIHWQPKQESSLNTLSEFHPKPLPFSAITPQFLARYEKWHKDKGNSQATAGKELSQIRAVIHAAIRERIISSVDNPFTTYNVRHGTGNRQSLTWEDVRQVETAELKKPEESRSRDVFFFQLYAGGRRVNEVLPLKWSDIEENHFTYTELKKGGKTVRRRRALNDELKTILARYRYRKEAGRIFVFPVYEDSADLNIRNVLSSGTSSINNGLYSIADRLGIPRFSSHVARHSWADLARKAGVGMYDISKNLGHSSLTVTEKYLSSFDQEAAELANDAVLASRPKTNA
jgi:integrase